MESFEKTVWAYYRAHGRHDLPWRKSETNGTVDPYKVLVSELMLQQTQVRRVIPKFESFILQFPDAAALASAPLGDVLVVWNGLGYNRRARFLWLAARKIVNEYNGSVPDSLIELVKLPGVGSNTAGAILAYAYNKPSIFVETNIRTVFIRYFFADKESVSDKEIIDLLAKTLPDNPREWYWALMDYGAHIKQTVGNLNTLSKHYSKQSAFSGSKRQTRGRVLRVLVDKTSTAEEFAAAIPDERLAEVLIELSKEGLIQKAGMYYKLADS